MRAGNRKSLIGIVHSNKMDKSITVDVERRVKHSQYGKYVVRTTRFAAHDEKNEALAGDRVEIAETRPLSKTKRWRLLRIIERSPARGEGTGA